MKINNIFDKLPDLEEGTVWLAGAGPGNIGLLSLLTLKALGQADVIIYDALVGQEIIDLAHKNAVLEYAGKRGGKASALQADISERLVEHARTGKRVLRLKGGDPLVFGRGGEEARILVKANIPFRIVPGITAGIGGLAYAGIPLTDRHTNSAVTFLTGHGEDGGLSKDIDWDALAKSSPVIVIYMALNRIELMCEQFLKSGRLPNETVAVISKATTDAQVVIETTLSNAAEDVRKAEIVAPAMIVLGENVKLRTGLDWLGAMEGKILNADLSSIIPQGKKQ
ncbi:MAG: uroporphyrinogen-III C-methyltransferase [Emcibacter sp.]|nr:uroporphyrinogen-III C-methyltransferase [Emcibacter sp.]